MGVDRQSGEFYAAPGTSDGSILGNSTTAKIGFYGTAPIAQRASSVQASSAIASSTDFGATQAAALTEVMATLQALGLWKGGA